MIILDKYLIEFYKLCELYQVERIYLFGSALSSDFNEKSDIDFLVKFKPIDLQKYFDNYLGFKEKLENLFSRKVDLVEEQTLKNPILIKSIENSKSLIYG